MNSTMKPLTTYEDGELAGEFRRGQGNYNHDGWEEHYDFENDPRLDEETKARYRREFQNKDRRNIKDMVD